MTKMVSLILRLFIFIHLLHKQSRVLCESNKTELNVIVTNPKDVEVILMCPKFNKKSSLYRISVPWLEDGLLNSYGMKWYQRRKIMSPAFNYEMLEQYVKIFDRQSDSLVETLSRFGAREKCDIYPIGFRYALDVLCETTLGTSANAQMNTDSDYVLANYKMSYIVHMRMSDHTLQDDDSFQFTPLDQQMNFAQKILFDFTERAIQRRRKKSQSLQKLQHSTFLDILMQAKIDDRSLTDLDLREELDTLLIGQKPVAVCIKFGLLNIAKYPEVQRKCFEEIRRVIGDQREKPVTIQQLNSLHYMDLVLKETMRLYPPLPLIARTITKDASINGATYPAGYNFFVPINSMSRNATNFPEPEQFRPDRYEQGEYDNGFSYIPFSAGPRSCLGQQYAVLALKSALSKVLRYNELELAEDSQEVPETYTNNLVEPSKKIHLYLKPRVYCNKKW